MCLRLHIRVKLSVHHYLIEEREQSKKAEGQGQGTRWELEQPGADTGVQEEPEAGKKERDSCLELEQEQLEVGKLAAGELEQVRAMTALEEQVQAMTALVGQVQSKTVVGRELEQATTAPGELEQDMTLEEQAPGTTVEEQEPVQGTTAEEQVVSRTVEEQEQVLGMTAEADIEVQGEPEVGTEELEEFVVGIEEQGSSGQASVKGTVYVN